MKQQQQLKQSRKSSSFDDEIDLTLSTTSSYSLSSSSPASSQSSSPSSSPPRSRPISIPSATTIAVDHQSYVNQYHNNNELDSDEEINNSKDAVTKHSENSNIQGAKVRDSPVRQRLFHHANNILVGFFIIATIVSNVRAITVAIVSNCARRVQQHQQQQSNNFNKKQLQHQQHQKQHRQNLQQTLGRTIFQVLLSFTCLLTLPLLLWGGSMPPLDERSIVLSFLQKVEIGWVSLLHVSIWPLTCVTLARAVFIGYRRNEVAKRAVTSAAAKDRVTAAAAVTSLSPSISRSVLWIVTGFALCTILGSQAQIIAPSWIWNPFLWGRLKVYYPKDIPRLLQGVCVEYDPSNPLFQNKSPLCLSRQSWKALSVEVLDSNNPRDVENVLKGVQYATQQSGGLIVNVMSRDTIDAIEPLRYNVEGLLPFFENKLSVVVFENDSKDGTREAFKQWASEAKGYKVDIMTCGEDNPDCKLGLSHRYDATEAKDYFMSSAVGKMADFRQRIVDYVKHSPDYKDYSHMLVLDLDLQVSISPLGLLHSLGTNQDSVVASAGRQVWPGSLGTLFPPYDFSAFRPMETPQTKQLQALHKWFCELMPPGDRWRNQCDAVSPMQLAEVLTFDWSGKEEPYPVASAFNGATLYPIKEMRETGTKYDVGDDGQRCEHIGFNQGFQKPMFINPKWNFHIAPENPGGPTGYRALRNVIRIMLTPRLATTIGLQIYISLACFVASVMILGVYILYPLLALTGVFGSRHCRTTTGECCLPLLAAAAAAGSTTTKSSSSSSDATAGYFEDAAASFRFPSFSSSNAVVSSSTSCTTSNNNHHLSPPPLMPKQRQTVKHV